MTRFGDNLKNYVEEPNCAAYIQEYTNKPYMDHIGCVTIEEIVQSINETVYGKDTSLYCTLNCWTSDRVGVGKGYVSIIYKIVFDWNQNGDSSKKLPKSVVLKIPSDNFLLNKGDALKPIQILLSFPNLVDRVHDQECRFYSYTRFPQHAKLARCYGFKSEPETKYLILEDFSEICSQVTELEGLNEKQALAVCQGIAQIHGHVMSHPEALKQICCYPDSTQYLQAFSDAVVCTLDTLIDMNIAELAQDKLEYLKQFCCNKDVIVQTFTKSHLNAGLPTTLVHFDLWHANLLFTKNEHATNSTKTGDDLIAIIDWQAQSTGNGLMDIARLLVFNLNTDLRRKLTDTVLSKYHQILVSTSGQTDISLQKIYAAYDAVFPYTVAYYMFPVLLNIATNSSGDVIHEMKSKAAHLMDEVMSKCQ